MHFSLFWGIISEKSERICKVICTYIYNFYKIFEVTGKIRKIKKKMFNMKKIMHPTVDPATFFLDVYARMSSPLLQNPSVCPCGHWQAQQCIQAPLKHRAAVVWLDESQGRFLFFFFFFFFFCRHGGGGVRPPPPPLDPLLCIANFLPFVLSRRTTTSFSRRKMSTTNSTSLSWTSKQPTTAQISSRINCQFRQPMTVVSSARGLRTVRSDAEEHVAEKRQPESAGTFRPELRTSTFFLYLFRLAFAKKMPPWNICWPVICLRIHHPNNFLANVWAVGPCSFVVLCTFLRPRVDLRVIVHEEMLCQWHAACCQQYKQAKWHIHVCAR